MTLGIFDIIVIVMVVVAIVSALYKGKTGPSEKEHAKLEAKYGRVLTDKDIKSYKSTQNFWGIVMTFVLVILVVSNL